MWWHFSSKLWNTLSYSLLEGRALAVTGCCIGCKNHTESHFVWWVQQKNLHCKMQGLLLHCGSFRKFALWHCCIWKFLGKLCSPHKNWWQNVCVMCRCAKSHSLFADFQWRKPTKRAESSQCGHHDITLRFFYLWMPSPWINLAALSIILWRLCSS